MSDDIVTRLRKEQRYQADRLGEEDSDDIAELARLAADEIERLRAIEAKAIALLQKSKATVAEYRREFAIGELPDVEELDSAAVELEKLVSATCFSPTPAAS